MARKLLSHKKRGEKMKVQLLVVDDDAAFLTFLKIRLKKDFTVFTANNFSKGLYYLKKHPVDFVLLDISIGADNGLKWIRS